MGYHAHPACTFLTKKQPSDLWVVVVVFKLWQVLRVEAKRNLGTGCCNSHNSIFTVTRRCDREWVLGRR